MHKEKTAAAAMHTALPKAGGVVLAPPAETVQPKVSAAAAAIATAQPAESSRCASVLPSFCCNELRGVVLLREKTEPTGAALYPDLFDSIDHCGPH